MASFPDCAFWDFSLELYARPGVAEACLRLQERHGVDVNLLLFCVWLGGPEGEALSPADVAALIARVRTLHEDVVRPLRTARTALKAMLASKPPALAAVVGQLRTDIKRSELEAEHLEQVMLAAARPVPERRAAATDSAQVRARANVEAYLSALGARLARADLADLELITASLPPPKA